MPDTRKPKTPFKAGWAWLSHMLIEHWVQIVWFGGAAFMIYLASLADWLKRYGPIAWGIAGLGTYLIFMIGYALYGIARKKIASSRLADERWKAGSINPLEDNFIKQRIKLSDFFNPFYNPVKTAKFQDCELLGPANTVLVNSTVIHCSLNGCQAVIIPGGKQIIGVTVFMNCIFERCNFYQITFYMTKEKYISMKQQIGSGLDIISDGKVGDL